MTANQIASQIRSWVDYIAGWILWLCWVGVVVIAAGTVLKETGFKIPFVQLRLPSLGLTNLCYLAGALWLLKK